MNPANYTPAVPDTFARTEDQNTARGPEIEAVRIKNFKKIVDTTIDLGPITYLVGGNNAGKSSVLQAVHTAVSCAQVSTELGEKVIAASSLRYAPTAEFAILGNGQRYNNNKKGGHRGSVTFTGKTAGPTKEEAEYTIQVYKARNHGNVGVERMGMFNGFGREICDSKSLFSVYVPGLAGVPQREEMKGYAHVFRKAASGDANLVFRNIIRLLKEQDKLCELETLVTDVLQETVTFHVNYDEVKDLYVEVLMATGPSPTNTDYFPVELWGTGVLQITQIFAYVLLFEPALLLVDEPDSHLHPSRQKSMGSALEKVAKEFRCKIIVSTHSRHLITSASSDVKVTWMKAGKVYSDRDRELAEILMDLGALDQMDTSAQIIICTEDSDPKHLKQTISSINSTDKKIEVISYSGVNNAPSAEMIQNMAELLQKDVKIIVHRDRDFFTPDEIDRWSTPFKQKGIKVFCPSLCDVEAYFTNPQHIAKVCNIDLADAETIRRQTLEKMRSSLYEKFSKKRREVNKSKLNQDGGAPRTEDLWPQNTLPQEDLIYGKSFCSTLEGKLREKRLLANNQKLSDQPSERLIGELKEFLLSESNASPR